MILAWPHHMFDRTTCRMLCVVLTHQSLCVTELALRQPRFLPLHQVFIALHRLLSAHNLFDLPLLSVDEDAIARLDPTCRRWPLPVPATSTFLARWPFQFFHLIFRFRLRFIVAIIVVITKRGDSFPLLPFRTALYCFPSSHLSQSILPNLLPSPISGSCII